MKVYYTPWISKNEGKTMKLPIIASAVLFAFIAEGANAACSTPAATQVKDNTTPSLTTLLDGKTACVAGPGGTWKFQEEHHAGGVLKDYKKGPVNTVDPTKTLGTWVVSGSGANTVVTYNYGTGGTYTYKVWANGGNSYSFCGVDTVDFTLKAGTGTGCP